MPTHTKRSRAKKKVAKKAPTHKLVKAYAVLGYPDQKPMAFGDKNKSIAGALSVFAKREDAVGMTTFKDGSRIKSWKIVPCVIAYKLPK